MHFILDIYVTIYLSLLKNSHETTLFKYSEVAFI